MKTLSHPKSHVLTVPNRLFHVFQSFQSVELNQIHFPENHPTTIYQNTNQSFPSLGIPLMWPIILTSFYKTGWYLFQATKFCSIRITGFCYSYLLLGLRRTTRRYPRSIVRVTIVRIGVTTEREIN